MSKILVTGGAGFIGSNVADYYIRQGAAVRVFDNLSRRGTPHNVEWLRQQHSDRFEFIQADIRDTKALTAAVADVDVIFHFAAQVAVTTSVTDPRGDFEINALGAFNVLEAARLSGRKPTLLFTSTNKVYGGMEDVVVAEGPQAYYFRDFPHGVSEERPLDFHSPYGCSKGAADQYVRDYARIYDLPTVVFRMSCIYGLRQFGNEDQGWLAHFAIAALLGKPIAIYGDGKQVRDVLFVEDLVRAFDLAVKNIDQVRGDVFNIGGGPQNALAVWAEFGPMLETLMDKTIPVTYGDWRPGDQRIYVSDIRKAQQCLGWTPQISKAEGIRRLVEWVQANRAQFG
jgi:CDP-paratose 2-epimerase